jgi:hypothetical protein
LFLDEFANRVRDAVNTVKGFDPWVHGFDSENDIPPALIYEVAHFLHWDDYMELALAGANPRLVREFCTLVHFPDIAAFDDKRECYSYPSFTKDCKWFGLSLQYHYLVWREIYKEVVEVGDLKAFSRAFFYSRKLFFSSPPQIQRKIRQLQGFLKRANNGEDFKE